MNTDEETNDRLERLHAEITLQTGARVPQQEILARLVEDAIESTAELIDQFDSQLNTSLCVFFVEAEAKWIGRFLVCVECVNQILAPDVAGGSMVLEFSGVRYFLAGFVREGVVDDDDTVTAPLRVVSLLEYLEAFFVELVFVPVVLGEELVQSALAFGRKNVSRNPLDSLVAGRNKTCHVRFSVVFLPRGETR